MVIGGIVVVAEGRYLTQAQPSSMCNALRARGHRVEVVDLRRSAHNLEDSDWMEGATLVVARGRSPQLLCLLQWAQHRGVPTVNRPEAIAAVVNKAGMATMLLAAGILTPPTYLGSPAGMAHRLPGSVFPVVVKPICGDNGQGLVVVQTPQDLASTWWPAETVVVQRYYPDHRWDLKLYGIGGQVWAVEKPGLVCRSGVLTTAPNHDQTRPVPMTDELATTARRCADLFGLELYGVDCLITERGPVVIEVNDFPNYSGVADAGDLLAEYLERRPRAGRAA